MGTRCRNERLMVKTDGEMFLLCEKKKEKKGINALQDEESYACLSCLSVCLFVCVC